MRRVAAALLFLVASCATPEHSPYYDRALEIALKAKDADEARGRVAIEIIKETSVFGANAGTSDEQKRTAERELRAGLAEGLRRRCR